MAEFGFSPMADLCAWTNGEIYITDAELAGDGRKYMTNQAFRDSLHQLLDAVKAKMKECLPHPIIDRLPWNYAE